MSGLNQQFAKLRSAVRCSEGSNPSASTKFYARFVYRLGRCPFKAERRVRFSYRVPIMVLSYSGYYTGLSSRISGFDSPQDRQVLFQCSTAVVQLAVNQLVVGSIPACGANSIPPWCNGNTTGFELVIIGSIPIGGASFRLITAIKKWLSARTLN